MKVKLEEIIHEIKGQRLSVIFDGTTRIGELLFAIVFRYCNDNFNSIMIQLKKILFNLNIIEHILMAAMNYVEKYMK